MPAQTRDVSFSLVGTMELVWLGAFASLRKDPLPSLKTYLLSCYLFLKSV